MSVTVNGTNGLTFADGSTQATGFVAGMRNRIINGAMMIDQRNSGAAVSPLSGVTYLVDRFNVYFTQSNKFTVQQNAGSITPPAGFTNYLGFTSNSSYSSVSTDVFALGQKIEGLNVADLGWGTSNAKSVTLSFWVYSSVTGLTGGGIYNHSGTRGYIFSYTISSANTWQYVTVTVPGDTGGAGTWLTNNSDGIQCYFNLGSGTGNLGSPGSWYGGYAFGPTGAVSVVGTSGATFYITGVQLEKGSVATPFEYRQYGQELALCQRYYQYFGGIAPYARGGSGMTINSTTAEVYISTFPVQMRSTPSIGYSSVGDWNVGTYNNGYTCTAISINQSTPINCSVVLTTSGLPTNYPCIVYANNTTNARLTFIAEL